MSSGNLFYYKKFEEQLAAVLQSGNKPRLLLHSCCGPCSSSVLERLLSYFCVSVFYFNPNIYPQAEYERRKNEQIRFAHDFCPDVNVIEADYNPQVYYSAVEHVPDYEHQPEKGERCTVCYRLRMRAAALYAQKNGFDFFTTTLSVSPHKDAEKINTIGTKLQAELEESCAGQKIPIFLFSDFKKKNGFKRSLELSAEYGLYRQEYCGCVFSQSDRHTAMQV